MGLPLFPFWVDQKYEAVKLLGKGGGGYALLAKKKDQTVAIKLLNLTLVKDPVKIIQKFKKEFLTLKKLNHPHIGALYDFGFDTTLDHYYFAGEYIAGQDIHKACQNLPPEKIEALFVQALQALHYLHTFGRAGLRHNDIKAANILVTPNEKGEAQVKLIDFGLANLAPLEMRGGTASTMAPEQILYTFPDFVAGKKLPRPDLRCDLYSLGVLWYLCLTGQNPFFIPNDSKATLKRHFDFVPSPPSAIKPDIPTYLDTIILKLLKENPEDRYANAAEVIQDLRYLSGKPYSVIPSSMRRYFLPEGEWMGQRDVWKPLQEKWEEKSAQIVWIAGKKGLGKSKILEHFKNFVQSHEGKMLLLSQNTKEAMEEWLTDVNRLTQDFSQRLAIAVDNFNENHLAQETIQALFDKIGYAKKWASNPSIPWLFVFTTEQASVKNHAPLPSTTLHLKNFNTEELKEFVRRLSPQREIAPPENFVLKLYKHTNGNPLFVTSVLKILGERGLLWNDDGAWNSSLFSDIGIDFAKLDLPQDLNEILSQEWNLRTKEEKELLKWCACFPNGMPPDMISETNALEPMLALGLLEWDDKKRLRFKNGFFQKTVYEKLSAKEKQLFHEKIARVFEEQKKPLHWIAYHRTKTADEKGRLQALETLAQFYTDTERIDDALEARREELALLKKKSLPKKLEVVVQLLRLLKKQRAFKEAHKTIQEWLAKVPKTANYKGWRGAFLREQGILFLTENDLSQARKSFESAMAAIRSVKGHRKEKLILENMVAKTYLDEGKIEKAIALYQKTRKTKEKITNNDLGYAYLLNQNPKAIDYLKEDLQILKEGSDKTRLLRCHFLLGSANRKLRRDFSKAIHHYQKSVEIAKNIKDHDWQMRALNGVAATYLDNAHEKGGVAATKQALRYFEESLALCRHLKKDLASLDFETAAIYLNMATVHQEMGNFSKAHDALQTILTVLENKKQKESREWTRLCEAYIALADNLSLQNRHDQMEMPIKKAWEIARSSQSLLEHQLALQILWAEWAKATKNFSQLKEHLGLAENLQAKYKIQPTPMAKKRLEMLRKGHEEADTSMLFRSLS